MIEEVRLPEVGENIETGYVTQILVAVGDIIKVDQPVVELETDKAILEVPSSVAGKVVEILVKPDETIPIGHAIIKVDTGAGAAEDKPAPTAKEEPEAAEEPVPEPEVKDDAPAPTPEPQAPPVPAAEPSTEPKVGHQVAPASPSVRREARELGVDINLVTGSGPGGRISVEDVRNYTKGVMSTVGSTTGAAPAVAGTQPMPDFSRFGEIDRQPLSTVRRITAEGLAHAWHTIPHVTQFDEADITEVEAFRKRYGKVAEKAGGKLTVTAILLKVMASALKTFPKFNASIDMHTGEIIYKKYCHIAIAVDTDRGLLVPVIRNVDKKSIVELSAELGDKAERTRNKKIKPDELEGGSFTISNQGGIGGTNFTPIVYWPQVAILGVSRSSTKAVWADGKFEPRLILPLSLSYDHRIIDGAEAARFLSWVTKALQEPLLISLES